MKAFLLIFTILLLIVFIVLNILLFTQVNKNSTILHSKVYKSSLVSTDLLAKEEKLFLLRGHLKYFGTENYIALYQPYDKVQQNVIKQTIEHSKSKGVVIEN